MWLIYWCWKRIVKHCASMMLQWLLLMMYSEAFLLKVSYWAYTSAYLKLLMMNVISDEVTCIDFILGHSEVAPACVLFFLWWSYFLIFMTGQKQGILFVVLYFTSLRFFTACCWVLNAFSFSLNLLLPVFEFEYCTVVSVMCGSYCVIWTFWCFFVWDWTLCMRFSEVLHVGFIFCACNLLMCCL